MKSIQYAHNVYSICCGKYAKSVKINFHFINTQPNRLLALLVRPERYAKRQKKTSCTIKY